MGRLEDTKARLEAVLARFDAAATRVELLREENNSLHARVESSKQAAQALRLAAADALGEVDQAISLIANLDQSRGETANNEQDAIHQAAVIPAFSGPVAVTAATVDPEAEEDPSGEPRISIGLTTEVVSDVDESNSEDDEISGTNAIAEEATEAEEPVEVQWGDDEEVESDDQDAASDQPQSVIPPRDAGGGSWSILDD